MAAKLESITIDTQTAPVLGRQGERADGKATVVVSVSHRQHQLSLIFKNHPFKTLDQLTEEIRKEVEEFGKALAEAAGCPLL